MSALDGTPDMTDEQLRELLGHSQTIAVVGMSTNPDKAAGRVPRELIERGFTVIPVHPTATEIAGQTAYRTLEDVPVHVDIVDVFRPPVEAAGIAGEAVTIGANAVWLQQGIMSLPARRIAEASGLDFLEDVCIGETVERLDIRK